MNKMIPHAFQCPNIYADKLAYYLTPEEGVVLQRAVREILGWQNRIEARTAIIALSIFVEGRFRKGRPRTEENRLAYGCGLSIHTVRRALKELGKYAILKKAGPPTRDGQAYTLQDDADEIDWDGLRKRRADSDAANSKRTRGATAKSLEKRGHTEAAARFQDGVTPGVRGNVKRHDGVTPDVTLEVTPDVNNEYQGIPNTITTPPDAKRGDTSKVVVVADNSSEQPSENIAAGIDVNAVVAAVDTSSLSEPQRENFRLLQTIGFQPPSAARRYAARHPPDAVRGWVSYARSNVLSAGYVRKRLDEGDPPPPPSAQGGAQAHDEFR